MKTVTMFLDNDGQPHATAAIAVERNAQIKRAAMKADFISMLDDKFKALYDPCGRSYFEKTNMDIRAGRSEVVHILLENPEEIIAALNTYMEAIA